MKTLQIVLCFVRRSCLHSVRDGCSPSASRAAFSSDRDCRGACPAEDDGGALLVLPPTVPEAVDALGGPPEEARAAVLRSLALGRYDPVEELASVVTLGGSRADLAWDYSDRSLNGSAASKFFPDVTVLALVGWPAPWWSSSAGGTASSAPLALPRLTPALREGARRLGANVIFGLWGRHVGEHGEGGGDRSTVVTAEDAVFERLSADVGATAHPEHFLGHQVLAGRIDPGDPRLDAEAGLTAATVAGRKLNIRKRGGAGGGQRQNYAFFILNFAFSF